MFLDVTLTILLGTLSTANPVDPLENPLSLLKFEIEQGCDVTQLPDSIVWCNDSLNKNKRLPANTWCQSQDPHVPYLVCRGGRWNSRLDADFESGRHRRDIGRAVASLTDQTCQILCIDDLTGVETHSPPWFSQCPASVTLHPEGDSPDVTHTWQTPIANDTDGYITGLEHIVGPESPAVFTSSLSPGSHHVISFMSTDNDNLRWPCDFIIIAEVPDCPPIVHIDNGNITCTNDHTRDSNCTIDCIHGYYVNNTSSAVCQDDGTWSYGNDIPQCLPAVCGEDLGSGNYSDLEIVCDNDNDTREFDTVCWLRCLYNNTLRNDAELTRILDVLLSNINDTMNTSANAKQEADDARDLADYLQAVAEDALADYILAHNNTNSIREQLDDAVSDLNTLKAQLDEKQAELALAEEQFANAAANNDPEAAGLAAEVDNITVTIDVIIIALNDTQANVENINETLVNAVLAEETAKNLSEEAQSNYTNTDSLASELSAAADAAAAEASAAVAAYMIAEEYSMLADVEIPTYVKCQADGTWEIVGKPYCIDIHIPRLSCVPLLTVYLAGGQTEGVANWALPTVYDNAPNVTVVQLSGPQPGDSLALGQHVARYMATDAADSSTYCNTYINIEVRSCGILDDHYDNENLAYTCDSFEQGSECTLTCINYLTVTDPGTATCELDASMSPVDISWNLHGVTCEAESCPVPPTPDHGVLDCFSVSNSTTNSTNSTDTSGDCVVICDSGYMTPYQVSTSYTCNDDGTWTPAEFPTECILSGNAKFAEYDLVMSFIPSDECNKVDIDDLISQIEPILQAEMTSYPTCSGGYSCSLAVTQRDCMDGVDVSMLELELSVFVTCEGSPVGAPEEAPCDLELDLMASLKDSLTHSITDNNVLDGTQLTNVVLMAETTDIPTCAKGILVGHYCAKCPKGTFYNVDQDSCTKCVANSYQDSYHSNACITCPLGTRTGTAGATSSDECQAVCTSGTYSYTTVKPCTPCISGTYQDTTGSSECKQCPTGTWTTIEGGVASFDCTAYDIYFDTDQADFALTNATDQMTIVFWMKNNESPFVSVGVFYDTTDFAFVFEAGGANAQLLFKSVDNTPTDISIESYEWTMIGIVWDCPVVTLYKNGQSAFNFDIQDSCGQSDKLVMSANSGTILSGLGVSRVAEDDAEMLRLYEDCSNSLDNPAFSMDNLAGMRKAAIKYIPTSCSVTNETATDNICAVHLCDNGGGCVLNIDTGYSCNCTEEYGGPFCEEELVHGNWSEWYNGSSCSRTCGMGVRLQYRYCNNPVKSFYGNDCEGNDTDLVECFLEECTECPSLDSESGTTCDLEDDVCTPVCPRGYVLPKGQQNQLFKCGQSTKSEWVPLNRLPICAVSLQPVSYTIMMTFTLVDPVPCSDLSAVTALFATAVSSLRCVENASCTADVSITNCGAGPSYLVLTLTSPLTSTVPFDLPQFYNTAQMTESITEAVFAIYMLELTVQDLLDNPSSLSVVFDNITYTVLNNTDSIVVVSRTNCAAGQVPTQGVCAQCQKGTYTQGEWCLYCPRGTYMDEEAQTACIPCADRYSTMYIGARAASECYEVEPPPFVLNVLVIVLSVVFGLLAIAVIILAILCARRFYAGYKEREKYDMEADRTSLYTDFPDLAYNVFFKRRMVLGFDEDGLPIISKVPVQNGTIGHGDADLELDKIALAEDYPEEIPMPCKGNEPFAYPTEYDEPPFEYDPYSLWPEDSVPPPVIPEPDFDFPGVNLALRFRMPGRSHLQQVYPLQMFGYQEKIRGRTRQLLPQPVAIPIPKHLPQLMYRPPKQMSLTEQLKTKFGIRPKRDRDEMREPLLGDRHGRGRYDPPLSVPPLSYKTKDLKPPYRPKSMISADSWSVKPNRTLAERVKSARNQLRSAPDKRSPRSPRDMDMSPRLARSAVGITRPPRSIASFTSRIARSAGANPRLTDDDSPHPKPSRFIVPKTPPTRFSTPKTPPTLPRFSTPKTPSFSKFPTRSMLKSAEPSLREPRPATSFTGRKSVTIKEGDMITRPTTAVTDLSRAHSSDTRPTTAFTDLSRGGSSDIRSTRDIHLTPYHSRPWSSMYSTAGTEDANIFDLDWVGSEYGGTSRPSTSLSRPFTSMTRSTATTHRPKTPLIHPAPNIHGNVKVVTRTPDFNMLIPKNKLKFGVPPADPKMPFMAPPPVFKSKVKPQPHKQPAQGPKHVWEADDFMDDNEEEDSLETDTFFLTEVPEVHKNGGKGQKTSPPPPYSEVNQLTENTSSQEDL